MKTRRAFGWVLALMLTLAWFSPGEQAVRSLPAHLTLTAGQAETYTLGGWWTLEERTGSAEVLSSGDQTLGEVTVSGQSAGTSELLLKWLGLIPVKRVEVQVSPEKRLIPGGMAIGVALRTDGVLVVGTSDLSDGTSPAKASGILPGDVLRSVDGVTILTSDQLSRLVAQAGERPLPVELTRDGSPVSVTLTPHLDKQTGTPRVGLWVRDSTAGVGTLSFYDPDTGAYAALGHAITDGDTGRVLPLSDGQILKADVVSVQKGVKGTPGELKGSFLREAHVLGDIQRNSILGIYGRMDEPAVNALYPAGLPVGLRSGVHTGPASILSSVDGEGVKEYAVEITRVVPQASPAPKSMTLRVTDPALLEKTGGIVQGMSGSPILQDGRLIGSVTHVFVGDPAQGYGLYIDWMLESAGAVGQ